MGILNVDNIQPVGGGTTITLNSSEINVGTGVTFESNGQANFAGVVTATSFVGDGSGLTGAGPTLTNGSNNRVVTATGANGINGEANLTFDGSNVIHAGGDGRRYSFAGGGSSHYMKFDSTLNGIILNGYGGIAFETNGTNERVRIQSNGFVGIGTDNAVNPLEVWGSSVDLLLMDTQAYSQNVSGSAIAFQGYDSAGSRKTLADV